MIKGYRVVEIKNGKVLSLFHGTNGAREIPLDRWNKANSRLVRDGTNGKYYMSGWHFLPTKEEAQNFFRNSFRKKEGRYIVRCYLQGNIRPKEHSLKGKCCLADEIFISSEDIAKLEVIP